MPHDPFDRPQFDPAGQRRITEIARKRPPQPATATADGADVVYNDYAKVANKAKALAKAIEPEAQKYTVPVKEFATEVRAAVKRKDQFSTDGSLITFDLFRDAIDALEKRRNSVDLQEISVNLTGNVLVDARWLDGQRAKVDNPDLDKEQLAMLASNLLILFVLNQMLGPWKAIDTQQMTGPKLPPGTETGGLIAQTIIGIVMQLLVAGLQEQAIEGFLKRCGVVALTGRQPSDLIQQARGRKLDEVQDLASRKLGEADYELILDYVKDFIANTELAGYEHWLAYWDARQIRQTAMSTWRSGPQYSRRQAQYKFRGEVEGPDLDLAVDSALRNAIDASITTADPAYLCTLGEQADGMDKALNLIGQVTATQVSKDAVCCLVRYFGQIGDPRMLRSLRAALHVLLSLRSSIANLNFSAFAANFVDFLSEELSIQLRDMFMHFLAGVFKPIEDFMLKPDDKEWELLFGCPLIKDLIDLLMGLSIDLSTLFRDFMDGFVVDFRRGAESREDRWLIVYQTKKIRTILLVLDQVLETLEHGNLCDPTDTSGWDRVYNNITNDLPNIPSVVYPPDFVAEFFGDSKPIEFTFPAGQTEIRDTIPPMQNPQITLGAGGTTEVRCQRAFGSVLDQLSGSGRV